MAKQRPWRYLQALQTSPSRVKYIAKRRPTKLEVAIKAYKDLKNSNDKPTH